MNRIVLTITSCFKNSRVVGLCAREIASESFDEASVAEIELAVVEAANNCIEHACACSENHQISIEFYLDEELLTIELIDQGKAIEPEQLKNSNADFNFDTTDIKNLPEGGMGLKIVKKCMDEVIYQHLNSRNHWLLTKYRQNK